LSAVRRPSALLRTGPSTAAKTFFLDPWLLVFCFLALDSGIFILQAFIH